MAINRKGLRKITVDSQEYFWRFVVDGADIFQEDPFGQIAVDFGYIPMIEDLGERNRGKGRPLFEPGAVTPKHISQAIGFARTSGWLEGKINLAYLDGEFSVAD